MLYHRQPMALSVGHWPWLCYLVYIIGSFTNTCLKYVCFYPKYGGHNIQNMPACVLKVQHIIPPHKVHFSAPYI